VGKRVTDLAKLAAILGCSEEEAIAFSSQVQERLSPVPSYADIAGAITGMRRKDQRPERVVAAIKKHRTQSATGRSVYRRRRKPPAGPEITIDESGFIVPKGMIGEYVPREPPRSSLGKLEGPVTRGTEFAKLRSRFAAKEPARARKGSQTKTKPTGREGKGTADSQGKVPGGGARKKGVGRSVKGGTTDCHVCGARLGWGQLKEHLRTVHGKELGGTGGQEG